MRKELSRPLLLRGKMVNPDGSAPDRYILVRNGRVVSVTTSRPAREKDAVFIKTDANEWIFPGLINLHSHSDYNLIPLWISPLSPFNHRHEWRNDSGYAEKVKNIYKIINVQRYRKTLAVFAELQAVAGGTTILQESKDLEKDLHPRHRLLLCRDTADPRDLFLNKDKTILSIVDLFKPDDTGKKPIPQDSIQSYLELRRKKTLIATLAHLAEGRSGFGTDRGVDLYSRLEFEAFIAHPAFKDAHAVRETPFSLIHCSGIDVKSPKHIEFLRKRNISIIWSPVSNLLLYDDTLDVESLCAEGINVALGSDWSPSGSKHAWDEAKFARYYLDIIGAEISNEQIFQMVTTNAGRCLGLPHAGRIEPGSFGDFFVIRSPLETDSALEVFFSTTDRHVCATIIGGRAIYGERDFLNKFPLDLQSLPRAEGSAVKNKAVHVPPEFGIDMGGDILRMERVMKSLQPPVKRSNLLSSSDKIYRRRLQYLRAHTAYRSWNIQEWRKRGPSEHPGYVPVSPGAVRVWRGFRSKNITQKDFYDYLGRIFIPTVVQTQAPLGMTAYLPSVLPYNKPASIPDEIALVFYESKNTYSQTFKRVIGRAYALLHRPVFGPDSVSEFPTLLKDKFSPNCSYYLFKTKTDWYQGLCGVLVGTRIRPQTPKDFHKAIFTKLKTLQMHQQEGLDGVITVATDDYLIYWEHWNNSTNGEDSKGIYELAALTKVVMLTNKAEETKIPTRLNEKFNGLEIKGGESMNLRFQRRYLFPY